MAAQGIEIETAKCKIEIDFVRTVARAVIESRTADGRCLGLDRAVLVDRIVEAGYGGMVEDLGEEAEVESGSGSCLDHHRRRRRRQSLEVAVVGLLDNHREEVADHEVRSGRSSAHLVLLVEETGRICGEVRQWRR